MTSHCAYVLVTATAAAASEVAALNLRRASSSVTLLARIRIVLAINTGGIGNATQSFAETARTMYALLSDVNIIVTEASPTHMPMR